MSRKIQTVYTKWPTKVMACMGDSLTFNDSTGLYPDQQYTFITARLLNNLGATVTGRNFGVSGDTTTGMLGRMARIFDWEIPDLLVYYGGINDPGNSILPATTQANIQASILFAQIKADGSATTESGLPANALIGAKYVVVTDGSSTGGVDPTLVPGSQATRLGGTATSPTVWQNVTGAAGTSGWCRITPDKTQGVQRIMVMSTPFLNFTPNGDVANPPSQLASNGNTKAAQSAAATAMSVPFFDLWQYQANLIINGIETQNSNTWHCAAGNIHPSYHGTQSWSLGLSNFINSQSGWLAALTVS